MDKEELLAEAKRRYPVGVKIRSDHSGSIFSISKNEFQLIGNDIQGIGSNLSKNSMTFSTPFVYYAKKWAKIVEKSEPIYEVYSRIGSNCLYIGCVVFRTSG